MSDFRTGLITAIVNASDNAQPTPSGDDFWVAGSAEDFVFAILSHLGICPTDGEPMPCMTCGAGL